MIASYPPPGCREIGKVYVNDSTGETFIVIGQNPNWTAYDESSGAYTQAAVIEAIKAAESIKEELADESPKIYESRR